MKKRVLSVSYDESLLTTRQMLLEQHGVEVRSALGFAEAIHLCRTEKFDLAILGHSIPLEDKKLIVDQLREVCRTPILALRRPNEGHLLEADFNLDSTEPAKFVALVKQILNHHAPWA